MSRYVPCSFARAIPSSSIKVACSTDATPARIAFLMPCGACACAATRNPKLLASLTAACNSSSVNSCAFGLLPCVSTAPVERVVRSTFFNSAKKMTPKIRSHFQYSILAFRRSGHLHHVSLNHLPQHIRQDPAILVIRHLFRRIHTRHHGELLRGAVVVHHRNANIDPRRKSRNSSNLKRFFAGQSKRLSIRTRLKLERQNSHPHQVAAMNPLVTFRNHFAYTQQLRAFGRPIARRSRPVFFARQNDQRHPSLAVFHRSIVNTHLLATRLIRSPTAFRPRRQLILQLYVRNRAAHHHFMISAARAVRIEFMRLH